MVRNLGQLQQEVAALEETVADVAVELRHLYEEYLDSLSQAARQQLIVASYQVCTQVYPESFLTLSLKQKEKLQEEIRHLGNQLLPQLIAALDAEVKETDALELNILEQMLDADEELESSLDLPNQSLPEDREDVTADDELTEQASEPPLKDPEKLVYWYKQIERGIEQTLENASKEVNSLLHQVQVLPSQLPASIIDVAMEAEETGASVSGSPNLLNLLIEAEGSEKSAIAKITAIRLRRSEIEFSDPALSAQRQPIRKLLEKISQMRQQYRQIKRDCAIAEAEAAWRASWYER